MVPREDAPGLGVYTQTKAIGQRARDPFVEIIHQWGGSAAPRLENFRPRNANPRIGPMPPLLISTIHIFFLKFLRLLIKRVQP
jgi:hypothetical protein